MAPRAVGWRIRGLASDGLRTPASLKLGVETVGQASP
jgi:hypothetical protein